MNYNNLSKRTKVAVDIMKIAGMILLISGLILIFIAFNVAFPSVGLALFFIGLVFFLLPVVLLLAFKKTTWYFAILILSLGLLFTSYVLFSILSLNFFYALVFVLLLIPLILFLIPLILLISDKDNYFSLIH